MFKKLLIMLMAMLLLACSKPYSIGYNPSASGSYSVGLTKTDNAWTYDFTGLGLDDSMVSMDAYDRITEVAAYYFDDSVKLDELPPYALPTPDNLALYYVRILPTNGYWTVNSQNYSAQNVTAPQNLTSSFFVGDVFGMQSTPEFDTATQVRVIVSDSTEARQVFDGVPNGAVHFR